MKTVITERNFYGEGKHRLQSGFWDFSKHHHFIPKVCRPYRAQTKGKVERFIHYLRHSFYNPLTGELTPDVETANQRVLTWLNTVANCRIHATTKEIPFKRLEQERVSLQSIMPNYSGVVPDDSLVKRRTIPLPDVSVQPHDLSIYEQLITKENPL